jgi:hypothetical protein
MYTTKLVVYSFYFVLPKINFLKFDNLRLSVVGEGPPSPSDEIRFLVTSEPTHFFFLLPGKRSKDMANILLQKTFK